MDEQQKIVEQILALTSAEKAIGAMDDPDMDAFLQISGMVQDLNARLIAISNNPAVAPLSQQDIDALEGARDALSSAVAQSKTADAVLAAAAALASL